MNWKFVDNRPIYAQIVEEIQRRILSGLYPSGASLPSVRQLAEEASVNPNTMQKAMAELEVQGLIHTQRTSGRTVSTDEELKMQLKTQIAGGYIDQYFEGMKSLGIEPDAAIKMLTERKDPNTASGTSAATTNTTEGANTKAQAKQQKTAATQQAKAAPSTNTTKEVS